MGSGLDRVKVLDMSHQNIRSISPSDSDTFQMFRESIMSINLTFNAIVNVDVHAFDNFTPLRAVQVDLTGNADIPCHQMCLLSSLKRPHIEYKGECTGTDGERISFSSHSNPLNCQDLKVDATDPSNAVQSAVKVSYDGPSAAVYAGIGLVVCGIFAVCIFTAAAFLIIRRRKRTRKQENPRKVSRRVVNMNANPLYEERMMSGSSGMFGMSRSSENILYSTSERPKPELPSNVNLAYTREDESSCEFHIYEEADAVTGIRNVQNPIYDGSSD
ncbi:uncharacterized protein LOC134183478 [Corticium candelabrum]|uniref:uncharacterized protein LOC134183478 n=1 Tax=Corticium candelabrum TaxID=121492 RepID=UPI002E26907A|nr:uncharacterized protein LOC134183478 [Corticium candelabrum]